jgi:hypothetical protein
MLACLAALLGADRAHAAVPSVTYECTPAPADCTGWYRSDVAIDWTVLPSNSAVAGCQDKTFTTDTPSTNEFCSADDGAAIVTVELKIKVDKTPPVVTGGEPARPADVDGWYNRAVSVAFSGSDLTSGIETCTATTYGGPDSGAARLEGTCSDKAGNTSAPFGYGLKYDATAPSVTGATPDRAANAGGWFNRPVRFDVEGTDATSGIADCPFASYQGPDSATASVTGTCSDRAGNSARRAFPFKYDATAPVARSGQAERPPDHNGWYNRPVAVAFSGADQLSGLAGCTATSYGGPDAAAASVPGTCTDNAGNVSAPVALGLSYDATRPGVTGGRPSRPPDVDGWYNRTVEVAFAGTDQTAGIAGCTRATYSGPDSATGALAGTCADRAGNVSSPLPFGLKYDATAPVVTAADPDDPPNAAGWFSRPVAFTIRGTDATSGVAGCPAVTYAGPDGTAASVTGRCRDRAGNSSDRAFGLKYDATAPEVTGATPERPPGDAGWYNRPVSLTFAGRDTTSGVGECATRTYAGPDSADASVTGTCTDKAGNVSGARPFALKYDATAPVVAGGTPARPADANGWYNRAVAVAFAGTDGTSGVAACTTAEYGGPDSGGASVTGICEDRAGNSGPPRGFTLKYDATGPEVTGATPERPPDQAGWYVSPVAFDVTGRDATSGLDACPPVVYAGPDAAGAVVAGRCRDRAGNSSTRVFPLDYDAGPPPLTDLTATGGEASITVSWRTSEDARSVEVRRTPGVGAEPASIVFAGPGSSFVDRRVQHGVRYAYEVRLRDAAGNASAATVTGTPAALPTPGAPALPAAAAPAPAAAAPVPAPVRREGPRIAPAPGAVLLAGTPPLLEWPAVPRARYYNLQLFRDGHKILSAWPKVARHQLRQRWTFRGRRMRLRPGRYRWMVWPGYGRRSEGDYGKRIVKSTFEVRRVK